MHEETFYDEEIGPAIADIAKRCEARGMSLVAIVAYDEDGSAASTAALAKDAPFLLRVAETLRHCWTAGGGVNVDSLIMALMKHGREHGHGSMLLHQLGVPTKPAEPA